MGKSKETVQDRKKRARAILRRLHKLYPHADCALQHDNALQLLIATILSAQSTDETVNRVTGGLFDKYERPEDFAQAGLEELQQDIRASGFFRQKAKNIQAACRLLVQEFNSEVPDRMDDLLRLPGVARKTANVVLGTWFGRNDGVVVDTHVGRIAERLGLTVNSKNSKDAVRIEADLMDVIPKKEWTYFSHALIWHGRKLCTARKPKCAECALEPHCPAAGELVRESGGAAPSTSTRPGTKQRSSRR